jgi:hypothetical protein
MKDRIQKLTQVDPDCEFYGPASPDSISQVEARLGIELPSDFRTFLRQVGGGGPISFTISGVDDTSPLEEDFGSLLGDTLLYRSEFNLPDHLVVIQRDQDENDPHCLDLCRSDENTCPVVGFCMVSGKITDLGENFEEYYMKWTSPYVKNG